MRNLARAFSIALLLFGSSFPIAIHAAESDRRKVTVTWRELEKATKYDFQLAASPEMDPLLDRKQTDAHKMTLQLAPGAYYFRVRGIDKADAPGPWSEVQGFVVNRAAPALLSPEEGQSLTVRLNADAIPFQWERAEAGTKYWLEVHDEKGEVLKRHVNDPPFDWKPAQAGKYRWRVGYEVPGGQEWGKYRDFTVAERSEFDTPAAPSEMSVSTEPSEPSTAPGASSSTPGELWFLARFAQSIVAYQAEDLDSAVNGSGAALVGMYSAELRWRAPKSAESKWAFSGALNLELIRQNVLDTDFNLPRASVRAFFTREQGPRWRVGPFLQLSANRSGVFVVQGETEARRANVLRTGIGIGGTTVYKPAPSLLLSLIALARMDSGGESADLPNPLQTSLGFEAGFGAALELGHGLLLEGRLRALQESFSWTPAIGGAANSSLNQVFIIMDIGLGLRL